MYNAGNSMQYFLTTFTGKESAKEWVYVYEQLGHSVVHLKLIQYCESVILQYIIKIKVKRSILNLRTPTRVSVLSSGSLWRLM